MEMMFRGVKLSVPKIHHDAKTGILTYYFTNDIDHQTRASWLNAGYPVFYNESEKAYWFLYDYKTSYCGPDEVEHAKNSSCECGAKAVGSNKHSTWCGAYGN